jgi:hypothetical protein
MGEDEGKGSNLEVGLVVVCAVAMMAVLWIFEPAGRGDGGSAHEVSKTKDQDDFDGRESCAGGDEGGKLILC